MRNGEAGRSDRGIEKLLHERHGTKVAFRVLGSLEVYIGGTPVRLGGRKQRAVLGRLLVAPGRVVPTGTLIEDLYEGAAQDGALPSLHVHVSNLRRALEPGRVPRTPSRLLVARPPGYLLVASDVDALKFARLVTGSEHLPAERVLAMTKEALALWRGTPYSEFAGELWALPEVNRLSELRQVAVERHAAALLELGRPQAAIHDLEHESAEHPLRERLWCLLALALYRSGRQADALAALRRAREIVREQLGVDPGPELQALEDGILRQDPCLLPPSRPVPVPAPPVPAPPVPAASGSDHAPSRQGRDEQLEEMETVLHRGGVNTIAVSGEPGIGKTWLLRSFLQRCTRTDDLVVLWGDCQEVDGAVPLWPWIPALRTLAGVHPPGDRAALAGLLSGEPPAGLPGGANLQRRRAIADWLVSAARVRPTLVVFDDLHWADAATLRLLGDVISLTKDRKEQLQLTLVMAFRDDVGCPAVEDLLRRLARHGLLRLHLTGLSADAVQAVAAAMKTELDASSARRLTERTGGNPFFVREILRLLSRGRPLDTLPGAVADLIGQRLATAGPMVDDVLRIAAVVGREFDPEVVAEVLRAPAYHVLDRAVRAGLVVPAGKRLAFANDLVRETLLQRIPPLRKATVHREVMTALAARPGVDLPVVAHHAIEAGPAAYGEAVRWCRATAEQAALRFDYENAAIWWSHAVAAHGSSAGDPADHVELLLCQRRALLAAGDPARARQVWAQALRVADRIGGRDGAELAVRVLTALDAPSMWTACRTWDEWDVRLEHRFEMALRTVPDADGPVRARLLAGLAQELYRNRDTRSRLYAAEAVAMARRMDEPLLLMQALNTRYASIPGEDGKQRQATAEELNGLARRTSAPDFELLAQMMLTHHRLREYDVAGADRAAARCDALLERLPLPGPRFHHTLWQAGRLVLAGRFGGAQRLYREAERQADRIGMCDAGAAVTLGRVVLAYHRGTIAEAGPLIGSVTGLHRAVEQSLRVPHLSARGRAEEARKTAGDGWLSPPADSSWLTATCLQGAAQAAMGDVVACGVTYDALLPHCGRISVGAAFAFLGPVDWFLAMLAWTRNDRAAARRHAADLAERAGRVGLLAWRDRALGVARMGRSPLEPPDGDALGQ